MHPFHFHFTVPKTFLSTWKGAVQYPVIFPSARTILSWPFDDPVAIEGTEEEKLIKFGQVRDEIEEKVKVWVHEYRSQQQGR